MITRHVSDLVVQLRLEHAVGWHTANPDPRCLGCAEDLANEAEAHDRNAAPEGTAALGEEMDAADDYACPCGKPQSEHCGTCYHCPGTHDECCGW